MSFANLLQERREVLCSAAPSGMTETLIPGVHLFWAEEDTPRAPLFYRPGIAIIGQGHKIGYLNDRSFRYDPENYLVVALPCPAECESHASSKGPLLGVFIDIELSRLYSMVSRMAAHLPAEQAWQTCASYSIEPTRLDPKMKAAAERLVMCMASPSESLVLGPSIVDELIYRALLGDNGKALFELTQNGSVAARISRAMTHIHMNYMETITVKQLAKIAGMSVSGFHRDFKDIVGHSPAQYIKLIRLDTAKALLAQPGMTAKSASLTVGYASPSQFSRDFRKVYGTTPARSS